MGCSIFCSGRLLRFGKVMVFWLLVSVVRLLSWLLILIIVVCVVWISCVGLVVLLWCNFLSV